jgi:aldose 1-epimerase
MKPTLMALAAAAFVAAQPPAARYAASRDKDVVRLEDRATDTVVSVLPAVGNVTFELKVRGQNVLHWPYTSVDAFKARPGFSGIPFLGPWANRLDEQAFYANGKKYAFDMQLGNVRGAIPIHGLLTWTDRWQVREVRAGGGGAWVTSRLEFYRHPDWMKQFPFAHAIEMTHTLSDGVLRIAAKIESLSAEPMPVAIGFHPYFHVTDAPRDEWTIAVGARKQWLLAESKIPTGEVEPIEKFFADPRAAMLKSYDLDHVFGDLIAGDDGRAVMSVRGKTQQIDVLFGPKYRAAVIYAPAGRNYICFEPMAAITDAMNLAHKGLYSELQSVPPGGTWEESFWIRPKGF